MNTPTYLIDTSIFIFRAWFALPDTLTCPRGQPVNAVVGFMNFVRNLMREEHPERIAFAFDESLGRHYRQAIYPLYKAHRPPAPEALKRQFRLCRELLDAHGLTTLSSREYEADDLIGTLATRERRAGHPVILATGDKDLTQLVTDGDLWWEPRQNRRLDPGGIRKMLGVRPDQVADQLALAGDKVDNIPGIPGVGMTTAARLLRRTDTLEALLADIPAVAHMPIRGARRLMGLIEAHQDTVRLARRLTGIHCQVPLPEGLDLRPGPDDETRWRALYAELGLDGTPVTQALSL
ncbi:5'-3' exonuclease [Ectothiorhodospira lacustris]|uniref:5'-3' exonuclease n=1 Tax=Ectothiorhodospira lacustris TaxID=2899127 RepID=UPI001EE8D044|nr:flap endonuclease [Ectothiorhodospira lacustris]MCG5509863.1 flap endonuclease [Ectothiorhodospira lacustris]MCG5521116.1 flap endonuclease [Ectothiorhodospira lacustris]